MFLDFDAERIEQFTATWEGWFRSRLAPKPPLSFPAPADNAVLNDFLVALSQEAPAIILVNNKLWDAFASRRNLVCQEILKNGTMLSDFHKLYLELKEKIEKAWSRAKSFLPSPEEEKLEISYYRYLLDNSTGSEISTFYGKSIEKKPYKENFEILNGALAFFVGFDPSKWNVFRNRDIHLLIPKDYNLKLDGTETALLPEHFRQTLYLQEIKLGLKIRQMTIIQFGDPYNLTLSPLSSGPESPLSSGPDETLENIFSNVFISKNDLKIPSSKKASLPQSGGLKIPSPENVALLPSWSIYLGGHGDYATNINQLDQLNREVSVRAQEIGFITQCSPETRTINPEYCQKLDQLRNLLARSGGTIAGLTIEAFREFLQSLEKINTNFFIYKTCYAGDRHLELPYQTLGFPLIYPFPIVASGISANTSKTVGGFTTFPSQNITNIEVTEKKDLLYKITPHLDFKKFFETLTLTTTLTPWTYTDVTNYVLTWKVALENIPNIRLPGTDRFTVINSPELIHLTKVRASIAAAENRPIIIEPIKIKTKQEPIKGLTIPDEPPPINPKAVLLYTPYLPITIEIELDKKENLPFFIPMVAGQTEYYIGRIISKDHTLEQVIASFFKLSHIATNKTILIENLECKDQLNRFINYKNVIIEQKIVEKQEGLIGLVINLYYETNGEFYKVEEIFLEQGKKPEEKLEERIRVKKIFSREALLDRFKTTKQNLERTFGPIIFESTFLRTIAKKLYEQITIRLGILKNKIDLLKDDPLKKGLLLDFQTLYQDFENLKMRPQEKDIRSLIEEQRRIIKKIESLEKEAVRSKLP